MDERYGTKKEKYPRQYIKEQKCQTIACPNCGAEGPFDILGTAMFLDVTDDGVIDFEDVEFIEEGSTTCKTCGHLGILEDFRISTDEEEL